MPNFFTLPRRTGMQPNFPGMEGGSDGFNQGGWPGGGYSGIPAQMPQPQGPIAYDPQNPMMPGSGKPQLPGMQGPLFRPGQGWPGGGIWSMPAMRNMVPLASLLGRNFGDSPFGGRLPY